LTQPSLLNDQVYRLVYKDPLLYENANPAEYSAAVYECVGWLDRSIRLDEVGLVWLRRSGTRFSGEREPPGARGIVVPKGCVVELRRLKVL